MRDDNAPYTGQCLCGAIKYEVDRIEPRMGHCHCSMCRKFHGAAFATLGEAKKENFRWIEGEDCLESYVASNGTTRRFCKICGSSMTFAASKDTAFPLQEEVIEFALGTLDSNLDMSPDAHVYTGSKANWNNINDELPRYVAGRDSDKEI